MPKIPLQFEKSDGNHFTLEANADNTVAQLREDIAIEEKIEVPKLSYVLDQEDAEDPETLVVSEPQDLPDEALISQCPLSDAIIYISSIRQFQTSPSSFGICVTVADRKLDVEVKLQQTLNDFREEVKVQHNVSIDDHVLILVGKELKGDDLPIWDLGFVPDCTIHAGQFQSKNNGHWILTSVNSPFCGCRN